MKKLLNSLLLFIATTGSAQINARFIQHLTNNHLRSEHLAYLSSLPPSDSANYYMAWYSITYQQDSLFLASFKKSSPICENDTTLLKKAGLYFLTRDNSYSKEWFAFTAPKHSQDDHSKVYQAALNPKHYPRDSLSPAIQQTFSAYQKVSRKSPLLAATLSAVVPGSGKLYAGKKKTFLLTFLLNAAYAAQTVESAVKLGPQHPFTIVNLAGFSIFYLANIYGSYRAVKVLRNERKKQFLNDAVNFYN